jgi:hypothetical protein
MMEHGRHGYFYGKTRVLCMSSVLFRDPPVSVVSRLSIGLISLADRPRTLLHVWYLLRFSSTLVTQCRPRACAFA